MENPATWGPAERVVQQALSNAERGCEEGRIGFSTAKQVTNALRMAGLTPEGERARIVWWLRAGVDGPGGMPIMASERRLLLDLADVIEQHPERFADAPSVAVAPAPDGT